MMITVPSVNAGFPYSSRLYGFGLGQDDTTDSIEDPTTGISYSLTTGLPITTSIVPLTGDTGGTDTESLLNSQISSEGVPLSSLVSVASGAAPPTAAAVQQVIQQGTSSGLTPTQIAQIITSATNAGLAVFKATSSPSLIPGTNLVYNPATGGIANATTGLTGAQIAAGLGGISIGTIALIGGALLILMMLEKR
jgi:hypothetical protein